MILFSHMKISVIYGEHSDMEYEAYGIISSYYPGSEFAPDGDIVINVPEIISAAGAVTKRDRRRALYKYLAGANGHELPWGVLTGIRPTKLTMQRLSEGDSIVQAAKYMQEEYFVSPEKSVLAAVISARELAVAERIHAGDGYNIYVGIPFCPSRCYYCSFASHPIDKWKGRTREYIDAEMKELERTVELFDGKTCHSLYIGGGTPTALPEEDFEYLLTRVGELVDISSLCEYTVEAGRPDCTSREKLLAMKRAGVTRISINPQTMNDKTLKVIGRKHSACDIIQTFGLARELGFDNINMDIILGLEGETASSVQHTIDEIGKLQPDNLTVHALALKRASRLVMESETPVAAGPGDCEAAEMMAIASRGAGMMGLNPYYLYRQKNMAGSLENVGYAAPGKEGIYNILMMEEMESIAAVGAGTVSKLVRPDGRIDRCDDVKDADLYISRIDEMIERKEKLFKEN